MYKHCNKTFSASHSEPASVRKPPARIQSTHTRTHRHTCTLWYTSITSDAEAFSFIQLRSLTELLQLSTTCKHTQYTHTHTNTRTYVYSMTYYCHCCIEFFTRSTTSLKQMQVFTMAKKGETGFRLNWLTVRTPRFDPVLTSSLVLPSCWTCPPYKWNHCDTWRAGLLNSWEVCH